MYFLNIFVASFVALSTAGIIPQEQGDGIEVDNNLLGMFDVKDGDLQQRKKRDDSTESDEDKLCSNSQKRFEEMLEMSETTDEENIEVKELLAILNNCEEWVGFLNVDCEIPTHIKIAVKIVKRFETLAKQNSAAEAVRNIEIAELDKCAVDISAEWGKLCDEKLSRLGKLAEQDETDSSDEEEVEELLLVLNYCDGWNDLKQLSCPNDRFVIEVLNKEGPERLGKNAAVLAYIDKVGPIPENCKDLESSSVEAEDLEASDAQSKRKRRDLCEDNFERLMEIAGEDETDEKEEEEVKELVLQLKSCDNWSNMQKLSCDNEFLVEFLNEAVEEALKEPGQNEAVRAMISNLKVLVEKCAAAKTGSEEATQSRKKRSTRRKGFGLKKFTCNDIRNKLAEIEETGGVDVPEGMVERLQEKMEKCERRKSENGGNDDIWDDIWEFFASDNGGRGNSLQQKRRKRDSSEETDNDAVCAVSMIWLAHIAMKDETSSEDKTQVEMLVKVLNGCEGWTALQEISCSNGLLIEIIKGIIENVAESTEKNAAMRAIFGNLKVITQTCDLVNDKVLSSEESDDQPTREKRTTDEEDECTLDLGRLAEILKKKKNQRTEEHKSEIT